MAIIWPIKLKWLQREFISTGWDLQVTAVVGFSIKFAVTKVKRIFDRWTMWRPALSISTQQIYFLKFKALFCATLDIATIQLKRCFENKSNNLNFWSISAFFIIITSCMLHRPRVEYLKVEKCFLSSSFQECLYSVMMMMMMMMNVSHHTDGARFWDNKVSK